MVKIKESIINSLILGAYMLFCYCAELKALLGLGAFLKVAVILISFSPLFLKRKCKFSFAGLAFFLVVFVLDIYNGQLSSVTLYVLSAPILASFVTLNKFNLSILYFLFFIIGFSLLVACMIGMADEVLINSRNFVSVTILFNTVLLTYIVYRQTREIVLSPSLLALIICVLAMGRGGIICASFLFLGCFVLKVIVKYSFKTKIIIFSFLSVAVLTSISSIIYLYESTEYLERIRTRGMTDYSRERIMEAYLSHMDLHNVIFGYDVSQDSTIHSFGDNPHNSYIRLHSHMGIFFLIPLFLVLNAFYSFFKTRFYLGIVFLTVLLARSFTDMILLNHYDFIIMIFVFDAIASKRELIQEIDISEI